MEGQSRGAGGTAGAGARQEGGTGQGGTVQGVTAQGATAQGATAQSLLSRCDLGEKPAHLATRQLPAGENSSNPMDTAGKAPFFFPFSLLIFIFIFPFCFFFPSPLWMVFASWELVMGRSSHSLIFPFPVKFWQFVSTARTCLVVWLSRLPILSCFSGRTCSEFENLQIPSSQVPSTSCRCGHSQAGTRLQQQMDFPAFFSSTCCRPISAPFPCPKTFLNVEAAFDWEVFSFWISHGEI